MFIDRLICFCFFGVFGCFIDFLCLKCLGCVVFSGSLFLLGLVFSGVLLF